MDQNFENSGKDWCHLELLFISQFFAIPLHNASMEPVFLLLQAQGKKEMIVLKGFYSCGTISKELLVQISIFSWNAAYNYKNKIQSPEKYE